LVEVAERAGDFSAQAVARIEKDADRDKDIPARRALEYGLIDRVPATRDAA